MPQYFEDVEIGTTYASERGRTITEGDIWSWPTGKMEPIHTDREFVREETPYEDVLPQNSLIIAYMSMLHARSVDDDQAFVAVYGKDNYRFPNPIYPGDTVRTESEIVDKRDRDEDIGVVTTRITMRNQDDEVVAVGDTLSAIAKRPAGE